MPRLAPKKVRESPKKSVSKKRVLKKAAVKKIPALRPGAAAKKEGNKKNTGSGSWLLPHEKAILKLLRSRASRTGEREGRLHQLERHESNPIIEPRENVFWEMKATFNPGAVYADKRVHLLYRAIGSTDMSVLGYASTADGVTINERLLMPAFEPKARQSKITVPAEIPYQIYSSGGGWNGGCEDPRVTLINDRIYLMYTAFDGWGSVRIALSTIALEDFLQKKWQWKEPALISPPGEIHKNWVLFPEKINGKFAILHSISPTILIDYFDSLDDFNDEQWIRSHYNRAARTDGWDSWIRGAGPPPIKTKLGWLLLYHAMDVRDPNRYKLGAMVLDEDDPTKILYRSRVPILEPDADYENNGFKAGVVYSCGAVVKDNELYVYYGGGDSVTCVAMANLDKFLDELRKHGTPKLVSNKKEKNA
jgi:beta-1,2-mannobiose phosphorylase / 1,2-beta-oligomannan phosphorylase